MGWTSSAWELRTGGIRLGFIVQAERQKKNSYQRHSRGSIKVFAK